MVESSKYNYSKLNEIKDSNKEYDFYGTVIDSTFPHSEEYPSNYVSIIKVIDETSNFLEGLEEKDVFTIIMKASDISEMPFIHNVGDIIRIHRRYFRPKGCNSIYCNMTKANKVKSSWCLFSGTEEDSKEAGLAKESSSFNYTMEKNDHKLIDKLRSFGS